MISPQAPPLVGEVGERGTVALAATLRIRITVTLSLALSRRGRGDKAALRAGNELRFRPHGNDDLAAHISK